MELRQVQYFVEVAKREHVTEASHALHVAQSAVSRQIDNLEKELGVALFIREGRNVKLTPIGRIFLDQMEHALKLIDKAKREIDEYLDPNKGTVRIGFPSSLATYTLPTVISAFRANYPQVNFYLRQGSYRQLIEDVCNGEIDVALLGPLPKLNSKVIGTTLFVEKIVALLPSSHRLALLPSLQLSQLREDSFILFPGGFVLRKLVVDACHQIGFEPKVSFEGDDIDAIKGLVAAGLGVTLLPEVTLLDNMPHTTVKIPISVPTVTRTVGVIVPSDRELSPTEKLFYGFLKQFFHVLEEFSR